MSQDDWCLKSRDQCSRSWGWNTGLSDPTCAHISFQQAWQPQGKEPWAPRGHSWELSPSLMLEALLDVSFWVAYYHQCLSIST